MLALLRHQFPEGMSRICVAPGLRPLSGCCAVWRRGVDGQLQLERLPVTSLGRGFLGKVGGRVWVALGWRRVQNSRYAGPLALLRLVGLPDVKVAALVSRLLWARAS